MQLKMESLRSIGSIQPEVSHIGKKISSEHARLFGMESGVFGPDLRPVPQIDPGAAVEPLLVETWAQFEASYQSNARLMKFWHAVVENAVVYPPYGITTVGDIIIRDTVRTPETLFSTFPDTDREKLRELFNKGAGYVEVTPRVAPVDANASACFLLGFGMADNYFNWTLRYMSRIALFQNDQAADLLLVPEPKQRFVVQGLEALGVAPNSVQFISQPVRCTSLSICSPSALGRYELSPFITQTLREHPRVTSLWDRGQRRLYVPRRKVKMRNVINESEIEDHLVARGFKIFDSAKVSVTEQIAAFRSAEIIVSPHGAGLSNIVYSAPGSKVLEIIPEGYDQGVTSYRSLSDLFGLQYEQIFASEVRPDPKGNRCNSDIAVAMADLVSGLSRIGVK